MTNLRRELFLRLMDGHCIELMTIYLFRLNEMTRCDEILRFLINTKRTGKQFISTMEHDFKFSVFQMSKWVLSYIDKDLEIKKGLSKKEFLI